MPQAAAGEPKANCKEGAGASYEGVVSAVQANFRQRTAQEMPEKNAD
jgi:hypothetical protein